MSQLTWVERSGKAVGTVGEAGVDSNLNLSRVGRRVAVSRLTKPTGLPWNRDIWIINLERTGSGDRITFDPAREHDPAWSPDGSEIAFNSNRTGGRFSLFRRPSSRSGKDELAMKSEAHISTPDWSPNGRVLMYTEGGTDLWTLPLFGERKASVFHRTSYTERRPAFRLTATGWRSSQTSPAAAKSTFVRFRCRTDNSCLARWRPRGALEWGRSGTLLPGA